MINFKTIAKVLLVALFVCAYSGNVWAQGNNTPNVWAQGNNTPGWDEASPYNRGLKAKQDFLKGDVNSPIDPNVVQREEQEKAMCELLKCEDKGQNCVKGACQKVDASTGTGKRSEQPADFCSGDLGLFSSLIKTGQTIFQRLRDLIYVVAGFGIIAVAVGGFFGNLNWKWLGAIVISLVVVSTAGEIVVLITGCEQFGSSLVTNTLTHPTAMSQKEYQEIYTEPSNDTEKGWIKWNDKVAREHPDVYAGYDAQGDAGVDYDSEFDYGSMDGYDVQSSTLTHSDGRTMDNTDQAKLDRAIQNAKFEIDMDYDGGPVTK